MKKIFSVFVNVIFLSIAISFIVIAEFELGQLFNWPAWGYIIAGLLAFVLFFEILARLGKKRFETPISLFQKLDNHDQHVFGISIFVFLALISLTTSIPLSNENAKWLYITGFLSSLFLPWLILFLFGSEKLKDLVSTESFRNENTQDKVTILLTHLARLIIFPIAANFDLSVFWIFVLLAFFIDKPIYLIFGSQKLRYTVIPEWIKKMRSKE